MLTLPHINKNELEGLILASRKNMLRNPDFRVNQRGQSIYNYSAGAGYTVDDWLATGAILTPQSDSVKVATTAGFINFAQYIECPSCYAGLTMTLTFNVKSAAGGFYIGAYVDGVTSAALYTALSGTGIKRFTFTLPETISTSILVFFQGVVSGDYELRASKLEIGEVSTLAYDPPADYVEQLARCKRYYRLWTTAEARTEALKEVGLMRTASPTTGTIAIGGTTYYYASSDI